MDKNDGNDRLAMGRHNYFRPLIAGHWADVGILSVGNLCGVASRPAPSSRPSMPKKPTTYEEDTYDNPWRLISYPHRVRVSTGLELLMSAKPKVVVDWGAGGGEMIAALMSDGRGEEIELAVAYYPTAAASGRLEKRLGGDPRVGIADSIDRVEARLDGRAPEAIMCMGVLEHLPLRKRREFYNYCAQKLAPGGRVVIDVPVEIGPALLVKEFGRRVLKRREPEYGLAELSRAVLGFKLVDSARFDEGAGPDFIFTHKGFDHRAFREELRRHQNVRETVRTPVRWLPSWLCNQDIMFVGEPLREPGPADGGYAQMAREEMG
jgi:SAM-dependent methyltransferase